VAAAKRILTLGDHIPDLTLPGIDGGDIHLRDFRGRRLFIFMWASW